MANQWPSSREFVEAIQNPRIAFRDPNLRDAEAALDKLGLPVVSSGQFAYVFKLRNSQAGKAVGVRCFRGFIGDREKRYELIDAHLNSHANPSVASFEFDATGILIAGTSYPIVVMEWINGPTLDVYLDQVVSKKDVLVFLAEEWLKLISSLRSCQIAHGDLQHGNVLVQDGKLRLVDLDGMFVPAMHGRRAIELGHRHYQHPRRSEQFFNSELDNFSSLVVYLSLLAIADDPSLWHDFHDENLIFEQKDFIDPASSALFKRLSRLSPNVKRIAVVLETACKEEPSKTPNLLNFAAAKSSRLPAWMRAPMAVSVQTKTREVSSLATTITPSNASLGAIGSPPAQPQHIQQSSSVPPTAPSLDLHLILRQTLRRSFWIGVIGLLPFMLVGYPTVTQLYGELGMSSGQGALALFTYTGLCFMFGWYVVIRQYRKGGVQAFSPHPKILHSQLPSYKPTAPTASSTKRYSSPVATPVGSTGPTPQLLLVGNRISNIFHRPHCEWALKISYRNRITFRSSADAQSRGYRRCRVCLP